MGQRRLEGRFLRLLSGPPNITSIKRLPHPLDNSPGRKTMSSAEQKVAVVTGGSQGIGAGLVEAYRQRGWAVVANARAIKPSEDRDVLTVVGDLSEPETTHRIIGTALDGFGASIPS